MGGSRGAMWPHHRPRAEAGYSAGPSSGSLSRQRAYSRRKAMLKRRACAKASSPRPSSIALSISLAITRGSGEKCSTRCASACTRAALPASTGERASSEGPVLQRVLEQAGQQAHAEQAPAISRKGVGFAPRPRGEHQPAEAAADHEAPPGCRARSRDAAAGCALCPGSRRSEVRRSARCSARRRARPSPSRSRGAGDQVEDVVPEDEAAVGIQRAAIKDMLIRVANWLRWRRLP